MNASRRAATSLVSVVSIVASFAACSDSGDDEPSVRQAPEAAASPTTVPPAPSVPVPTASIDDGRSPSESTESTESTRATVVTAAPTSPPPTAAVADGSIVSEFAGASWFLGEVPATATAADPTLPPIRLGMLNQEDTPVGSYPEVRIAVEAAAAWVNEELGGVDGRAVELHTCTVPFDAERSRSCAIELVDKGVVAFVGGVNVLSEPAFEVLDERGVVSIGGIPANLVEQRSPNAFFFSGGDAGALAAFMAHSAEQGHAKVALAFGEEVESFAVAARDYGAAVGRTLGLDVELIPFSMFAADYTPVMAEAVDVGADAVMVLAATSACVPVVEAAAGFDMPLYLTGACASEATIRTAADAGVDAVWNAEGPVDGDVVEASLYQTVIDRYADEPAGGSGTVGFRGFMNLYSLLSEVGGAAVSSTELADLARASVDRPSFWGHPYTCDGRQVPGLPALCAPQQLLFTADDEGGLVALTDWIPTDELFAATGAPSPG